MNQTRRLSDRILAAERRERQALAQKVEAAEAKAQHAQDALDAQKRAARLADFAERLENLVRSGRITGLDSGMFYFLAGTQPGREAEVLAEIDAEIARVQRGEVEAAEITRCQARLKAGRRQSMRACDSRRAPGWRRGRARPARRRLPTAGRGRPSRPSPRCGRLRRG